MDVHYDGVSVHASGRALVDALDLRVASGSVLGLVGPNGSGKSTALRCLYRALAPSAGAVHVDGRDVSTESMTASARKVAALPQQGGLELDYSVEEVVATGRFPHGFGGGTPRGEHRDHVEAALAAHDLLDLRHRGVARLSGGERQRVLLARAVAQDPRVLVLDEPTNHLDVGHQLALLAGLRAPGRTTLVALHDLNLAAAVCDELAVLSGGRLVARGAPEQLLADADLLLRVFGVVGHLVRHPTSGVPQLLWDLPAGVGAGAPVAGSRGSGPGGPRTSTTENSPGSPRTSTTENSPGSPRTSTTENSPGGPRTSTTEDSPGGPHTPTTEDSPGSPHTPTTETSTDHHHKENA